MAQSFPVFDSFEHVECAHCGRKITGPFNASGHAPGHGEWRGQCTSEGYGDRGCKLITYFDLKRATRREDVKPDYRFVKVDHTKTCGEEWMKERGLATAGVYYLIDANLHVHICSFTPSLEAWPMNAFVTYVSPEANEKDEGQAEIDLMVDEEPCSYFDVDVLQNPSISAAKYIPEREEGESDNDYRQRVAEEVREHVVGNPLWF